MLDALPGLSKLRSTPGTKTAKSPARETANRPAKRVQFHCAAGTQTQSALLDPRATALDQDDHDDDKQHSSSNPNDYGTIHVDSSFPQ
jgi:hypothetical protein